MAEEKFWVKTTLDKESIAESIVIIKKHLGLTTEEMAKDLGMSPKTLLLYETAKAKSVTSNLINRICEQYKLKSCIYVYE